jgi:GTP-binding nuclear protein Ran
VGSAGVGKTYFLKRHIRGDFVQEKCECTAEYEIHPLLFHTTGGTIKFNVWNTSGQEKQGSPRDSYYKNADAAIIMFDIGNRGTYDNVSAWHEDMTSVFEKEGKKDIPIVLVANKVDTEDLEVKANQITIHKVLGMEKFSVKSDQNFDAPMLYIAGKILNMDNLEKAEAAIGSA